MAYLRQTFSIGAILTAAQMNQVEANIAEVRKNHAGTQAPTEAEAGMIWVDTTTSGAWRMRFRDDAGWIDLFQINNLDNVATPAGDTAGARHGEARQTNLDATASEFAGPLLDFKNMVVNGAFQVWQRGRIFSSTASGTQLADRWGYAKHGTATGVVSITQETSNLPAEACGAALRVDVETAETEVNSGDYHIITHGIEGVVFRRAEWGTARARPVSISFWVYATKPGVYSLSLRNESRARSYVAEFTVADASAWQRIALYVPGDQSGAWDTGRNEGCVLAFCLMAGASRRVQPDEWATGNYLASVNQVNALDSTSNDFMVTLVQVEVGPAPTPFAERPHSIELLMCQRYFWKSFPPDIPPANNAGPEGGLGATGGATAGRALWYVRLPTTMRGTPTITTYNPSAANSSARNITDNQDRAINKFRITRDSFFITSTGTDSGDAGDEILIHATADAEFTPA